MSYRIAGITIRSVSYEMYHLKRYEIKICEKTGVDCHYILCFSSFREI
mgnify:CR=1 FL=1|jgi:hypothetical protein